MYYHVRITPRSNRTHDETEVNLSEDQVLTRFVHPYGRGQSIVIDGKTIPVDDLERIKISRSDADSDQLIRSIKVADRNSSVVVMGGPSYEWRAAAQAEDVTTEYLQGPPRYKKEIPLGPSFSALTSAEQAALLYAAGHRTQKEIMSRFEVPSTQFRKAREELRGRGLLDLNGAPSDDGIATIPGVEWQGILEILYRKHQRSEDRQTELIDASASQNLEISSLLEQVSELQQQLHDLKSVSDTHRDVAVMLTNFNPLKITVHWVRSAVALTLIEAAMKQKLENLGIGVKEGISFGDLRKTLEQALLDKEGRELRRRLLGLSELSIMRNKIVHAGHQFVDLPKDEADSIESAVANLIAEILE